MRHPWHNHPTGAGTASSFGDRAADVMRYGMGSWPFVFAFLAWMGAWMWVNSGLLERVLHHRPFDPYPYVLLNLVLSTLAGLQGAVLLIAQKRADKIAAELASLHFETSRRNWRLLQRIAEARGIRTDDLEEQA